MARLLVLMGSGETTPTMVEVHKRVLAAVGPDPDARVLDTPYGFQRNADEITQRTVAYFDHNVGAAVAPVELRSVDDLSPARLEDAVASVAAADWVFAGPGSPTYLLRQWGRTRLPGVLRDRLERPGATVFASAAVCSVGRATVPVYEIYKVGEAPHWEDGFALTDALGWSCVVIPHFDNAEGGTHDTRYCYLGEERLAAMEVQLPDDVWVLGVDEHTAAILDLDAGTMTVEGRGGVTLRDRDRQEVLPVGSTVAIDEVPGLVRGAHATARPDPYGPPADAGPEPAIEADATPFLDEVAAHEAEVLDALDGEDALAAADATLALARTLQAWSADTQQSDEMDRARQTLERVVVRLARLAQRGMTSRRDVVAPLVTALLDLRARARDEGDYATADAVRDALTDAGIEVRDTTDGVAWAVTDDPG